jgi:hypothetical protein
MVMLSGTGYIAKSRSRKTKKKLGIVCVWEESAAPRTERKQKAGPSYLPSPDRHLRSEAWDSRVEMAGTLRRRTGGTRPAERGHEDGRYMERRAGKEATSQSGAAVMFYNNNNR